MAAAQHTWRFFRSGGFDQVRLDSAADLVHLDQLDQKLWAALSCPASGLEFDSRTLELIDTNHDGRIRCSEIIAATKWVCARLKNPADLAKGASSLPLAAINDATPEGKLLVQAARQILNDLGKSQETSISIEDTTDTTRIFAETVLNGDGVIVVDSALDPAIQAVIQNIVDCMESLPDRSGKPGVNQAKVDQFFADIVSLAAWDVAGATNTAWHPLGERTQAAFDALQAVRSKIEDYFARCRLAAYDARAVMALNRNESDYLDVAAKDFSIHAVEIAHFPLSKVEALRPLPLKHSINPAWEERLQTFYVATVRPLLGEREELTESDLAAIISRLSAFEEWHRIKPQTCLDKLGLPRVREIVELNPKAAIDKLLADDTSLAAFADQIEAVDRLVRLHRDLYRLLCNFVNFRDFYGRQTKAIFQAGTLYLDQRSCDLCVRVDDAAKHGTLAHLSRAYLAYCECTRKDDQAEKMTIVAAFTAGDSDYLMVGRNGLFYDRKGRDWDATITKIVDNPINIRQAFWAPYKRALRWIEDQLAKRAAAADAAVNDKLTGAITTAATTPVDPTKPPVKKMDVGTVAALGVAVGGITAALGGLLEAFLGLGLWMPIGIVTGILLISGPSMLVAWLKLRQRNLGPMLDANGWAVNSRAMISLSFGELLTKNAQLPSGSKRDVFDPYAPKRSVLSLLLNLILWTAGIAVLWAAWNFGVLEKLTPGLFPKSQWVLDHLAKPAAPK